MSRLINPAWLFTLTLLITHLCAPPVSAQATVDLGYSTYQGTTLNNGVNQYLGMRFVASPLFISGGGYDQLSNANYNGSTIVANSGMNVILVNFNYRVGSFGFLASEKVRSNGDLNAGMLDQIKALNWVKEHISCDPDHVVIHGDSAGADSVALLLTAYGGRNDNLFIGAIVESVFFPTQPTVSELEFQFDRYIVDTGCNSSTDPMTCLRSANSTILLSAMSLHPFPTRTSNPLWYWAPAIDGNLIQDYPYNLFTQGKFIHVPLMVGDDNNEGSDFAPNATSPSDIATFFQDNFPKLTDDDVAAINAQYPLMPPLPQHAAYFPSASAAYGEAAFICPGLLISQSMSNTTQPVWNYRYNVEDTSATAAAGRGVFHVSELPAIFGPGNVYESLDNSLDTYNNPIVSVVMDYYVSYVRALDPNRFKDVGATDWGTFGEGLSRAGMRLVVKTGNESDGSVVDQSGMESVPGEQSERCGFWMGLAVRMEQ